MGKVEWIALAVNSDEASNRIDWNTNRNSDDPVDVGIGDKSSVREG
jgi:hypothetical protein